MTGKAKIGAFKTDSPLELVQAQNGGWVVFAAPAERGFTREMLGAYTNPIDMIEALSSALLTSSNRDTP